MLDIDIINVAACYLNYTVVGEIAQECDYCHMTSKNMWNQDRIHDCLSFEIAIQGTKAANPKVLLLTSPAYGIYAKKHPSYSDQYRSFIADEVYTQKGMSSIQRGL